MSRRDFLLALASGAAVAASAARVTADCDGELVLTVRVPANESRRFFRLCVDFPR